MAIKLEMLRCYHAVAESGSLAEAASRLGRTPSAVSMMLRQFEDHVGAPLFESARKSHLTPLGAQVAEKAADTLAQFDGTVAGIAALARAEDGHVRLSVTPSVAQTLMPPILERFLAKRPRVGIEMRDTDSAGVERDLKRGAADIVAGSLPALPGFERTLILSDRYGVVCPGGHPLAREWDALGWDDLEALPFIANGLCALITDPGFAPILAASRLTVRNTASILALVRAGAGITVLPERAVLPGFDDLAFLPLANQGLRREVWMLHAPTRALTPVAAALSADIRAAYATPPAQAISA